LGNKFIDHLQVVTANNYNTITDFHITIPSACFHKSLLRNSSPQWLFFCNVFTRPFLVTNLNNRDCSASVVTPLPSGQHSTSELLSTVNSTATPPLLSLPCRTRLNCQPSINWVPGWRPFHTNLLVFSSQAEFQQNCHSAGLGSSLYSLRADPTENTASSNPYILVMDGCLTIAQMVLTCLPAATKQLMFLLGIVA
jgi:hypothetical protein